MRELPLNAEGPFIVAGDRRVIRVVIHGLAVVPPRIAGCRDVVERGIGIRENEHRGYLVRLRQRSLAVGTQALSVVRVRIHSPVVAIDTEAAANYPVVQRRPRETY